MWFAVDQYMYNKGQAVNPSKRFKSFLILLSLFTSPDLLENDLVI